ncbi:precorrin-2 C(20)-methyltransferase [Moritella viscosa]|uniref:Precorrin-2 C20-methyltransferase n=1 Tax=Moritella viscosa TaxID=80854 RepID=A0A1K9ZJ20_9GAMM|nr:precorrin-2 C(20)-methyltransferase [Moritella viscosa]SGY89476.1 Precorrin-2 C20-methyltransferase [Moritella viscosa]SGY97516.1 Precorrin-2 C20-methyltransferase [Moritella viscosa]SGY97651.1 Precorrin-2 C20-methyltransferase [Moritella viscosa]SHO04798.1 Precorrin-2 C20-methyltransferase [Moritella viscosa]SHO04800.1 Precorrin-2 C20-methyltransferase [Moritella viscosa]
MNNNQPGKLIGVGVGPGDPELMTLKAFRLLQKVDVICYLTNNDNISQAKMIASDAIDARKSPAIEIGIVMPMSKDRTLANQAYDDGAARVQQQLELGKDVVFICEGDPLFFGSFSYLLERLEAQFVCEVVPGITSINAASSALVSPLTALTDSFAVVSGRHSDEFLRQTLSEHNSVVIMKAGQSRPRILAALAATGRMQDASYLEYISREQQIIENDVTKLAHEAGPYFSLFLVRHNVATR